MFSPRRVSSKVGQVLCFVSAFEEYGELGRWWRRTASDTGHPNTIFALLLHCSIVEQSFDVAVQVDIALDLIQKLALDRLLRYHPARSVVLCDYE